MANLDGEAAPASPAATASAEVVEAASPVGPADVQVELEKLKENLKRVGGTAGVPPELLESAKGLLAHQGLQALQEVADKAIEKTAEVSGPKCPKGCTLQRQAPGVSDWLNGVKCDRCGGSAFDGGDMWSCRDCDYDECGICAARLKCPAGHELEKKAAGFSDWLSGMTCDVCKKNPWKSGSVWSCRACDFDQCGSCSAEKSLSKAPQSPSAEKPESPASNAKTHGAAKAEVAPPVVPATSSDDRTVATSTEVRKDSKDSDLQEDDAACAGSPAAPASEVPASESAVIKKARDEALARKKAIEERMAADAAALLEEEQRLHEIRRKLGEADKVRQRSESLRSAIEQEKREIRRLEREKVQREDTVRQAEEAVRQAKAAQVACEAQLNAKNAHCQQLEQEMVDFLLQAEQQKEAGQEHQDGLPSDDSTTASSPSGAGAIPPPKDGLTSDESATIPPPPPPPLPAN